MQKFLTDQVPENRFIHRIVHRYCFI